MLEVALEHARVVEPVAGQVVVVLGLTVVVVAVAAAVVVVVVVVAAIEGETYVCL